jgi:predicted MFS family arabinose efflux permease
MLLVGIGIGVTYFSSLYYGMVFRTVRGRNTAIHESTIGAGFLSGAFGGGLVGEHWDLATPYLVCLGLILLAVCVWMIAALRARFLSRSARQEPFDRLGTLSRPPSGGQ